MNARNTIQSIALTTVLVVSIVACGGSGSDEGGGGGSGGEDSYTVGVILPLTGPAAAIGTDFNSALEVFREIDEDAQAVDIEYVVCDDKSTPDGAAACARQLIQQDAVNMIYGPVISGTHAGARPVLLSGPPAITPSPYASAEPGEPIFSASGNSLDLDTTTLQLAADRGYERVAVLATTDTTGETAVANLERANEEAGLEIAVERMGPTDVDASAQVNSLLETDPDYIYVAASGAAAGVALNALQQLGADLPTALIWSNTTNGFLQAAAPVLPSETLFAVSPSWLPESLDDTDRAAQIVDFQEAFEAEAGAPVSFVVQGAYDAFQLIAAALSEVGGDREDLLAYLEGLEDFQGLNWQLSYSADNHRGSASGNYTMMRYDGQSWSLAETP